jgi:hypothetical protein
VVTNHKYIGQRLFKGEDRRIFDAGEMAEPGSIVSPSRKGVVDLMVDPNNDAV